jgi:transcription antitermination factor NusG
MERQVDEFLTANGLDTFLPLVHKYIVRRRRKELTPFFSCYMFARVEPSSRAYLSLPWTPGLRSIVKFEGKIAPVPDDIISRLRDRLGQLDRSGYFERQHDFRPGDLVRITTGPLKDIDAVFDRALSKEGRVRVLLDILGRLTACEIDADWLQKIG